MTRMSLAERRHMLIEAALRVIGEHGVASATTRAIAAEAGMPLASFHYAFESHQNLMGEAMGVVMGDELATQRAWRLSGKSAGEMAQALLDSHLDALLERPAMYRTVMELGDYALRAPALAEVPGQWRAQRVEQLAAQVDRYTRAAGIRMARPAADFAEYIVTMADGLTRTWLVTQDEALVRSIAGLSASAVSSVAA